VHILWIYDWFDFNYWMCCFCWINVTACVVTVIRQRLVWWSRIFLWRWKHLPTVSRQSTLFWHDAGHIAYLTSASRNKHCSNLVEGGIAFVCEPVVCNFMFCLLDLTPISHFLDYFCQNIEYIWWNR